jgi:hypothetical protein
MNEENGLRGGKKYEELSLLNKENHIFCFRVIQEDLELSLECDDANFNKISSYKSAFEPYLIHSFVKVTADRILTLLRKINCESRIETGFATLF